jgi:hypothetical protein
MSIVRLNEDYKERAIAVFGKTKDYIDHFKEMKGLFNASLTDNGSKAAGWIFPKTKLEQVRELVKKINNGSIYPSPPSEEAKTYEKPSRETNTQKVSDKNVVISKEEFAYIMNKLTKLENEVNDLKKKVFPSDNKIESLITKKVTKKPEIKEESEDDNEEEDDDDDEEEEEIPKPSKGPSLLRRK